MMSAVSCSNCGGVPQEWSSCSKTAIEGFLKDLDNPIKQFSNSPEQCLLNDPGIAFGASVVCGDGIVSEGEQCDNGDSNGKDGICTSTCKLEAGKECSQGDCCSDNGMFKAAGAICRTAAHECDVVDMCT